MQQHPVAQGIRPAHHPWNQVMVVPTRLIGDGSSALGTLALLRDIQRCPLLDVRPALQQALAAQVFAICLPPRIKGVLAPHHLAVPDDLCIGEPIQPQPVHLTIL